MRIERAVDHLGDRCDNGLANQPEVGAGNGRNVLAAGCYGLPGCEVVGVVVADDHGGLPVVGGGFVALQGHRADDRECKPPFGGGESNQTCSGHPPCLTQHHPCIPLIERIADVGRRGFEPFSTGQFVEQPPVQPRVEQDDLLDHLAS